MPIRTLLDRITVNPNVCHGEPCIRDLRYPVKFIFALLQNGTSEEQLIADFPDLELEDFQAVRAYALDFHGKSKALEILLA
ncbi:MAG: DUF433 domain-containing protein [Verrucomicrobiota bacterium]